MNPLALLFLAFLLIPIVEIYLFIQVGGVIGAPATIGIVILTAIAGAWLFRAQGLSTLARARDSLRQGRAPALELLEGVLLLLAGAFLLTPGFFTDAIGFAFLIPPLRQGIVQAALRKGVVHFDPPQTEAPHETAAPRRPKQRPSGTTLEGEYTRHED